MSGQRINIYIRDDAEKEAVKTALQCYRENREIYKNDGVRLTAQQNEMITILKKELDEIKKLIMANQGSVPTNNSIDFEHKFGLIDEN